MPTFLATPGFSREHQKLTAQQKAAFADAVAKFVEDLKRREIEPGSEFWWASA